MKLIIAEKSVLAQQIVKALGTPEKVNHFTMRVGEYYVTYLGGHILRLYEPDEFDEKYKKWNLEDLPIYFPLWKKKPISEKQAIFNNVKSLISKADEIINAGDMDEEGQLLVDEVLTYCKNTKPVKRLNTADTTSKSLKKSLQNLGTNNVRYGNSANARSIADKVFGTNLSRFFSIKTGETMHIGRVKCPTMNLVIDRDKMIGEHTKRIYFVPVFMAKDRYISCEVKVEFPPEDELVDIDGYLSDPEKAQSFIESVNDHFFSGHIETDEEKNAPPMPFNLAKLQLYCEKKFGYTPSQTMEITQSLRDKYNAISYNRSECEYLPEDYYTERMSLINTVSSNLLTYSMAKEDCAEITEMLKNFALAQDKAEKHNFKSKCFNSEKVQLHFGIVPQEVTLDIEKMTEPEKNVYLSVARRYLMQFADESIAEKKSLIISLGNGRRAVCNSLKYKQLGWRSLVADRKISEEEKTVLFTPDEDEHDYLLKDGKLLQKETKPPKPYTEASLIKDMCRISRYVKDPEIKALLLAKDEDKTGDNGSIGTSATRDTIVKELIKGGYFSKEGKNIHATEKAIRLMKILPKEAQGVDITARWYVIQKEISDGNARIEDLTEKVKDDCIKIMGMAKNIERTIPEKFSQTEDEKGETVLCQCGGEIITKKFSDKETEKKEAVCECSACHARIYTNDRFFKKLGKNLSEKEVKKMLKNRKITTTLKSKAGKDYKATILVTFNEKNYPQYEFEERKNKDED